MEEPPNKLLLPYRMLRLIAVAVAVLAASEWTASGQGFTISTLVGGSQTSSVPATSASLYSPGSVAVDKSGNVFFVDGSSVLRVDANTGLLSLVAGAGFGSDSGDNGAATSATLTDPDGVAVDSAGNVYIADLSGSRIRKVSDGVITTAAAVGSGLGYNPAAAVEADSLGNVYFSVGQFSQVWKLSNGNLTLVAGSGGPSGANIALKLVQGLAIDSAGDLFIADPDNYVVRKIANGVMTVVAGNGTFGFSGDNGPATSAQLNGPEGIAVDSAGNLYIADNGNRRIRKVAGGIITTIAGGGPSLGDNGPATSALLSGPTGVAVDAAGNVYVGDSIGRRVRKIANGVITTLAGGGNSLGDNGRASAARLLSPAAVAVSPTGSLYIADALDQTIRMISNGLITTVAGNGTSGFGGDNGPATSAQLWFNFGGIAADAAGDLFIADLYNQRVRKVSKGVITTVAGTGIQGFSGDNGPATSAQLANPAGIAVDSTGSLYIADSGNNRIRKVLNGVITTVAGSGTSVFGGDGGDNGPATDAELAQPSLIAVDSSGNLFISGFSDSRIRKVSNGVITTVAGNGTFGFSGDGGPATSAQLADPKGLAVDSAGDLLIGDSSNNRIRKVANGVITTVAGSSLSGFSGDNGPALNAELGSLQGLAVDSAGNVYFVDSGRVRVLTPGIAPSIFPGGIVPVYSSNSAIQSGSWISIYGSNLASGSSVWNGDFPTSLAGTTVTVDNNQAYLWLVSPTQINLQVPTDATTGQVSVVVNTTTGTASSTVTLSPYAPSFSLFGDGRHAIGEILTPNGAGAYQNGGYDLVGPSNTFSFTTRPAKAGETLVLYGVGFGPTSPNVTAGQAFAGAAPAATAVSVTIGGVPANVGFAGITEAGLYQLNVTVPAGAGIGDQPLVATAADGSTTPAGVVVSLQ